MYQPLEHDTFSLIDEFKLCIGQNASVFAVNMNRGFELIMISPRKGTQTSLLALLPNTLLTSTRGSQVYSLCQYEDGLTTYFMVTTTNKAVMLFQETLGEVRHM